MRKLSIAGLVGLVAVLAFGATLSAEGIKFIQKPSGSKARATWINGVMVDHELHAQLGECATCHHMEDEGTEPYNYQSCSVEGCHFDTESNDPDSFYMAWHGKGEVSCMGCHQAMGVGISCTETCHTAPGK